MVFVELDHIGGAARQVDHAGIPGGVHHPQARALQRQRQRTKEGQYPFADAVVGQDGGGWVVRSVERPRLAKEPVVVVFAMSQQDIEVVVAEHAVRPFCLDQTLHQLDYSRAIGSPVGQVSGKHQPPRLRMGTVLGVAQPLEQGPQRLDFAMDIPHDIERAVGQRLDKLGQGGGS